MVSGRFAELILNGVKTTTIRLGKVIPKSSLVIIHSEGRPIAEAVIKSVVYKKVGELTEEDAKRDGYRSLEELLKDLERIYNVKISPEDIVTVIEFEVVKRLSDINPEDVYLGFSPQTIVLLANRYLRNSLSDEERKVIEALLRYRSIRTASIKLYGSLQKRWIIRRVLRMLLAKLIDRGIIEVDDKSIERLAAISGFWRRYLYEKRGKSGSVVKGAYDDRGREEEERGEQEEKK